jgi:hypothetical protein
LSVSVFVGAPGWAEQDSLLPTVDDVESTNEAAPTLGSAITQFNNILEDSPRGDINTLQSNTEYNKQRQKELQKELAEKTRYLEQLPQIVSQEFDSMMQKYPHVDQAQKDRIAQEIKKKWQQVEERLRRDISRIQEQLTEADSRVTDAEVKIQMLEISSSLDAAGFPVTLEEPQEEETRPGRSAFEELQGLSRRNVLSKVRSLCVVTVKPVDTELSVRYLDN